MRISSFLFTFFIAIATIGIFSCQKEEPDPNKDNRLFICRVNGVEWKPKVDFCFLCPTQPEQYARTDGGRTISLDATQDFTNKDNIEVYQFFHIGIGTVGSDNSVSQWHAVFTNLYNGDCGHYRMDTTYSNVLKITRFDGVYRGILKGEFGFRLVSLDENCADTLLITEGIFDLRTDI